MYFFTQDYFVNNTVIQGYVESVSQAPDRIYAQYRNKPKAVMWYRITMSLAEQIGSVASAVRTMYQIDSAQGEQLDVLGRIVVVSRNYIENLELNPGYFDLTDGSEFGDSVSMFSALSIDADSQMSDELYRLVIKSKILKNNSDASIESILFGMNFLLPNANFLRVTDNEDMSFSIEFYGTITELERWALLNSTLVPKPQGVKFNGFLEGFDYVQFNDTTKQFGDENSQFAGYTGV